MTLIEVTLHLPETLVKQAIQMGVLTDDYIEGLLRADIQAQLTQMANDPAIQRELAQSHAEFHATEWDGLEEG